MIRGKKRAADMQIFAEGDAAPGHAQHMGVHGHIPVLDIRLHPVEVAGLQYVGGHLPTVVPPACREAWIVTAADKWCSLLETLYIYKGHGPRGT